MPPCGSRRASRWWAGLFLVCVSRATHFCAAAPGLVWLAAPWIAWWISQPIESATPDLTPEQLTFLRRTARLTWHFFDTFVCAQENWLPPDNFQEIPAPTIATRTSPTNMGLALLANLAARDLGYLSLGGLIERTQDTLATMQRLERHRGHFYNWYETRTLKPLQPLYISSVDSGNLAGHLLTLAAGLREQADEKIFTPQIFAGLRDTVKVLQGLGSRKQIARRTRHRTGASPGQPARRVCLVGKCHDPGNQIAAALANEEKEISGWAKILKRDCEAHWKNCASSRPGCVAHLNCRREEAPTAKAENGKRKAEINQSLLTSAAAKSDNQLPPLDQALTLREVSRLDQSGLTKPVRAMPNSRAACVKPANTPASGCSRSKLWPGNATNWQRWILHFCSTSRGIYSPPDSMSPNAGLTPAFMICWPRRRACAAMSPSPWGRCRRIIGSRWAGCSSRRTASRFSFPGAARCLNI
jgi:hypothetical protein